MPVFYGRGIKELALTGETRRPKTWRIRAVVEPPRGHAFVAQDLRTVDDKFAQEIVDKFLKTGRGR